MQGIVKGIFDLERCWMRGNKNNQWIFASRGIAVKMHQLKPYRENRSTVSLGGSYQHLTPKLRFGVIHGGDFRK